MPPTETTMPPRAWRSHQHHWLHSERASFPGVAEWVKGNWHCVGEYDPVSPEEMYRRGWEWLAPAIAPQHPEYDR